jgi:hypothetical protein
MWVARLTEQHPRFVAWIAMIIDCRVMERAGTLPVWLASLFVNAACTEHDVLNDCHVVLIKCYCRP